MKRGLFLFTLLFAAVCAQAGEKKTLSVEDVDFGYSDSQSTVLVDVAYKKSQFKKITEKKDSVIEIRFYAAPASEKGSLPRIMKDRRYFLPSAISSFTLRPSEACPSAGAYKAKIWLSVRHDDGNNYSPNDNYETFEANYKYVCIDKYASSLKLSNTFNLGDQNNDGYADQVNLVLDMNKNQFRDLKDDGKEVEVTLYAHQNGTKVRVGKKKPYKMSSAKSSFSFSASALCGEMDDIWDWAFGKAVGVSCKVRVFNSDKTLDHTHTSYTCPQEHFICQ